jgi:hypothetical protein
VHVRVVVVVVGVGGGILADTGGALSVESDREDMRASILRLELVLGLYCYCTQVISLCRVQDLLDMASLSSDIARSKLLL